MEAFVEGMEAVGFILDSYMRTMYVEIRFWQEQPT
jgi:hypothetical protein